ncbi:GspH/FimT family pseudopilin [Marinobacter sp. MA]|uniref:GspH/FimT family protein n=1 Tax=Marinobacter sp. MA TaxID=2971606 RepID=UPI003AAE3876
MKKLRPLHSRGFTLVELLITLAILIIAAGIAVPAFSSLSLSNARTSSVNSYFGAFAFARYQAVKTRAITAICPLDEENKCVDDWNRQVSIFPDVDRDQRPDDNTIWRVINPRSSRLRVHSRTAGSGSFHFGPDGIVYGGTGSLVICPDDVSSGQMTYIAVSRGGRARQVRDDDGDGHIRLAWGGELTCS